MKQPTIRQKKKLRKLDRSWKEFSEFSEVYSEPFYMNGNPHLDFDGVLRFGP